MKDREIHGETNLLSTAQKISMDLMFMFGF